MTVMLGVLSVIVQYAIGAGGGTWCVETGCLEQTRFSAGLTSELFLLGLFSEEGLVEGYFWFF